MRDLIEKMGRHGLAVSASLLVSRGASLLLMPFLTDAMPRSDYGIHDNLHLIGQLIALVALQGIPSAMFREYAFEGEDNADRAAIVTTGFRYTAFSTLLLCVVFGLGSPGIAQAAADNSRLWGLFLLVLATHWFLNLRNICGQVLRAEYRSREYAILYCGEGLLCLVLNLYFVVFLRQGVAGLVYSNLIGAAASFLFGIFFVPECLGRTIDRARLARMVRFGWPLILPGLALFLLDAQDRFFFKWLLPESGLNVIGTYGRGASVASMLTSLLLMPFNLFWPTLYYDLAKRAHAAVDLGRCATYYAAVAGFLACGLSLIARPLVSLMTDKAYHDAYRVVPILAFAIALLGFSEVTKVGIFVTGRTRWMPWLVGLAVLVNGAVNLALIPSVGLTGAAWSSLAAYATLAAAAGLVSRKLMRVDYEWSRLLRVGAAIGVCLLAGLLLPQIDPLDVSIAGRGMILAIRGFAVVGLFPLVLLASGFFTRRELELAGLYLRRIAPWRSR